MAWEVVKDVYAAEFDNDGLGEEEGRAVFEHSERKETVALWAPSAEKLYLAVGRSIS